MHTPRTLARSEFVESSQSGRITDMIFDKFDSFAVVDFDRFSFTILNHNYLWYGWVALEYILSGYVPT